MYTPAVDEVNRRVEEYVLGLGSASPVAFAPCSQPWLEPDGGDHVRVKKGLMPDALHPSEKGMVVLAVRVRLTMRTPRE